VSFLLDTDTCSAHLRRPAGLTSRMVQHAGRLSVSILCVGELLTWALRRNAPPRRLDGVKDFLNEVEILPIGEKIAEAFARLRANQLDTGRLTPSTDLWIAATAIAHDLTLVTHNTQVLPDTQLLATGVTRCPTSSCSQLLTSVACRRRSLGTTRCEVPAACTFGHPGANSHAV
jgi:tRNA(fMet)-specific endonuclease VapC